MTLERLKIAPDRQNIARAKNLNTTAPVLEVNPEVEGTANDRKWTRINGIQVTLKVTTPRIWTKNRFFCESSKFSFLHFIPRITAESTIYGQMMNIMIP